MAFRLSRGREARGIDFAVGFLQITLTGEKANRPDVCHGKRQVLTPCSIALTIWDVMRA
jgi:hypothetical protein